MPLHRNGGLDTNTIRAVARSSPALARSYFLFLIGFFYITVAHGGRVTGPAVGARARAAAGARAVSGWGGLLIPVWQRPGSRGCRV